MVTGEATDLVARLNNAWVETVSPSPEGFRRSMVANVLNEARAAIQAHATLIEAQAAEIEAWKRRTQEAEFLMRAWIKLTDEADVRQNKNGYALSFIEGMRRNARAFLASRTERADG